MAKIRHSEAKYAVLYERLSRDDEHFGNFRHFTDDGYSGRSMGSKNVVAVQTGLW